MGIARRYGIYLVKGGVTSWLKSGFGGILRSREIRGAKLLRIDKGESLSHAEMISDLLHSIPDEVSETLSNLPSSIDRDVWRYSYLALIPFGIELPAIRVAFTEARKRREVFKPALPQTLLPAYMLELGGVSLGTNITQLTEGKFLVSIHGSLPSGEMIRPESRVGRGELLKLCKMLRSSDYVLPNESPIPLIGAAALRPVLATARRVGEGVSKMVEGISEGLARMALDIAGFKGVRRYAWDAFFYLTHVTVAVIVDKLMNSGLIPRVKEAEGVLEVLSLRPPKFIFMKGI